MDINIAAGQKPLVLVSMSVEERGAFKSGAVFDVGASDATLDVRFGRDCALLNFALDAALANPDEPVGTATPAGPGGPARLGSGIGSGMLAEVTTKRWVAMVLRQCDMATMHEMASGSPPAMDMKLRESAGAGETRELGTLTELVFWKTGGALVFTGGSTHVAKIAPGGDSFIQGVSVSSKTTVPDVLLQMAETLRLSLSVVGPLDAGVSLPTTSDGGLVVKGGRKIRDSAVRDSTPRVVVDRDGKFVLYAPAEGATVQWWVWLVIVLAGLVLVGGAVLLMRVARGKRSLR